MTLTSLDSHDPPHGRAWPVGETGMARLIRRFDWSATPLGPIEAWSEGFRGLVDVALGSATPTAIACGDDLTILFNDAWRGLVRRTEALGRSLRRVDAPPWPDIAPSTERAMADAAGADVAGPCDRVRFRLTPVYAGAARPAAVMVRLGEALPGLGRLSFSLRSSDLAIWELDLATDRMEWSRGLSRLHGREPGAAADGASWIAEVHPDDRPRVEEAMRAVRETGSPFRETYRIVRPDERVRWCTGTAEAVPGMDGAPARILGTAVDVTEDREALERQRLRFSELQHRLRNMLAVVRSIARRTADTSPDVEHFATHLEGRIDALARVQTLLMRDPEGRIDLEMLLREELRAAIAEESDVEIDGPPLNLAPKAGETVSLMFSELATNALKFGALAHEGGRLSVIWTVQPGGSVPELQLDWRETGLWLVEPPGTPGFGMELLTRTLPYDLGARVSVDFPSEGFRCRVTLPLTARVQR